MPGNVLTCHTQMTKGDVCSLGAGGDDVTDLDLPVVHDDAVDE